MHGSTWTADFKNNSIRESLWPQGASKSTLSSTENITKNWGYIEASSSADLPRIQCPSIAKKCCSLPVNLYANNYQKDGFGDTFLGMIFTIENGRRLHETDPNSSNLEKKIQRSSSSTLSLYSISNGVWHFELCFFQCFPTRWVAPLMPSLFPLRPLFRMEWFSMRLRTLSRQGLMSTWRSRLEAGTRRER